MKRLILALCLSTLAAAPALADMRDSMRGGMGGGMGGHHGGDFGRGDNRGGDWRGGGRGGDWRGGRDDHRGGGWGGGRGGHGGGWGGGGRHDDRGRGQLMGTSLRGGGYYYGNLDCQTAIYYFTGLSQGRPIQGSWYQGGDQPVRVLNQINCGWGITNTYMQVQGLDNGGIFVIRADDFRAF